MAITYFRCTNLDKNASSYNLYLKGVAENTLLETIPITGTETEIEFNLNEIDALKEPNTYKLYAQAISADINKFEHSDPSETLSYTVGDSGDTGDDDPEEEGGGGSEGDDTNQYYTFTIIPTPDTATVTLTSTGYAQDGNSITVLNESKV